MRLNDAYGRTFGLMTARGIALLQIAEHTAPPKEEREVRLMRVCDGFVEPGASEEDIRAVLERPEQFFLLTAIHVLTKQSRVYRQFFAFDGYYDVPRSVRLPNTCGDIWSIRRAMCAGTGAGGRAACACMSAC